MRVYYHDSTYLHLLDKLAKASASKAGGGRGFSRCVTKKSAQYDYRG
ncbi:hypothetical protein MNBD_GAMMA18-564 [hydrothermal vent metagenome]|uniref:Uncharacterized protein n=1 Tax=hydrothermal vent metagenome TaxID=652676 RepID=A0A3B0ZX53_9ZZZZ